MVRYRVGICWVGKTGDLSSVVWVLMSSILQDYVIDSVLKACIGKNVSTVIIKKVKEP